VSDASVYACRRCGRLSSDSTPLRLQLGWRTSDGFSLVWPTCGHGKYLLCRSCDQLIYKTQNYDGYSCPVCGCKEEYT
jgi:RNA polymerase subunit RPABC4/transcription elongation factor Spt4